MDVEPIGLETTVEMVSVECGSTLEDEGKVWLAVGVAPRV